MRHLIAIVLAVAAGHAHARAKTPPPGPSKADAAEMLHAMQLLDRAFGLESLPPPHCLKWGYGHVITPEEIKTCGNQALAGQSLPGLGSKYVLATIMAEIGPQTIVAVSLDPSGWVVLSCDPGKPCPPRKPGPDKYGLRVTDAMARACSKPTTIWFPEKKGCP